MNFCLRQKSISFVRFVTSENNLWYVASYIKLKLTLYFDFLLNNCINEQALIHVMSKYSTAHCPFVFLLNTLACHLCIHFQILRNFKS